MSTQSSPAPGLLSSPIFRQAIKRGGEPGGGKAMHFTGPGGPARATNHAADQQGYQTACLLRGPTVWGVWRPCTRHATGPPSNTRPPRHAASARSERKGFQRACCWRPSEAEIPPARTFRARLVCASSPPSLATALCAASWALQRPQNAQRARMVSKPGCSMSRGPGFFGRPLGSTLHVRVTY